MKRTLLLIGLAQIGWLFFPQVPPGYYTSENGLSGSKLQQALRNIIDDHNTQTYIPLWSAFEDTDKRPSGRVWDMYSDVPGGIQPYQFTFYSAQCGNYSCKGDCYNREHSFPRSWFGDDVYPMYSDLFHLYPTDGYINGKRGNFPYGEVNNASRTSLNGSKLGNNTYPGYGGTVFELIDGYKGDFARTYFYMATRYLGEDNGWPGSPMVGGSQPEAWALSMLFGSHKDDPVDQKEGARNDVVYDIQDNRNPFIDHPEYVDAIWFNPAVAERAMLNRINFNIYPNPVVDEIFVLVAGEAREGNISISITDGAACVVFSCDYASRENISIDAGRLSKGFYFLSITNGSKIPPLVFKFIK